MQWNLIRLRKEHGLSQTDLAKVLNISLSAYQNKETGKSSFRDYEMFIISKYFDELMDNIFLPSKCINNAINVKQEA